MEIKLNNINISMLEGYVRELHKDGDGRLRFILESFSISKTGTVFSCPMKCVIIGPEPIRLLEQTLMNGDLVLAQGAIRWYEDQNSYAIIISHIKHTTPITRELPVKPVDLEAHNGK